MDITGVGQIYYHKSCLVQMQYKINYTPNKSTNAGKRHFKIFAVAYEKTKKFVHKFIIHENKVSTLTDVYELLTEYCMDDVSDNSEPDLSLYRCDYLLSKLKRDIKSLASSVVQKRTYLYNNSSSLSDLLRATKMSPPSSDFLRNTAFTIRRQILAMKSMDLDLKHKNGAIFDKTGEIPLDLLDFITALLVGPKSSGKDRNNVKIVSICHHIMHCVTNGQLKTPVSVYLGLAMKTLTSSKKIVNILNRLGLCSSYNVVSQIETELAHISEERQCRLPDGFVANRPDLCTGVAWDNYDRFVETKDGFDTLHDTVGIVYQNISQDTDSDVMAVNTSNICAAVERSNQRKSFVSCYDTSIDNTYVRTQKLFPLLSGRLSNYSTRDVAHIDNLWMVINALTSTKQKWRDWNAHITNDPCPKQKIGYLPQINESPTKDNVVYKTMLITKELAMECNQEFISVTYDLAIAMKAYRIQKDCSPIFDSIFIHIGEFHVLLAFYKALGKFVDDSGIPRLMVVSKIIADGSLNSFISGKNYNRCKELHSVMALSFKILHFQEFLKTYQEKHCDFDANEIQDILQSRCDVPEKIALLNDFLTDYEKYFEKSFNGDFGKTPQYICMYIHFVDIINFHERSIRTIDVDLYKYASNEINAVFFAFNHQNYAKWMCRYIDNLENIEKTHPGLLNQFQNGAFSIRRSAKNFSRTPIDLTLEQTINANASNRLKGITAFTNNINARQKWATTHSIRTFIVHQFFEFIGTIKLDDLNERQYETRIFKDKVHRFMEVIRESLNPCDEKINANYLFNLSSGKAASDDTADFLLNVLSLGKRNLVAFKQECILSPKRFEEPICRNKLTTFSSEICKPKKNTRIHDKINEIRLEKQVIWQIFSMAIDRKIDIEMVLSHPLTNVPHSLAYPDGTIHSVRKIDETKTILMQKMDASEPILNIIYDVEIINGTEFLNTFHDVPVQYGKLAMFILKKLCQNRASEVHVIFSKNPLEGIPVMNYESQKHQNLYDDKSVAFKITGANQERSLPWHKCLSSQSFQNELVNFVMNHLESDLETDEILGNKRVFIGFGQECFLFANGHKKKQIFALQNNLINFDCKAILHLSKTCNNCNIVIRTRNIDSILILILYHMQYINENKLIWIDTNYLNKKGGDLIDIRKIFITLSSTILNALPAWYIFTGCAYEPSFFGKTRKKTYQLLEKEMWIQEAFGKLGTREHPPKEVCDAIEAFTTKLYKAGENKVNTARAQIFQSAFNNKKGETKFLSQK